MSSKRTPTHPYWATQFRKAGTELRKIAGRYYLYEVHSVYDPLKKGSKKISGPILGSITEEKGFVESSKRKLKEQLSHLSGSISGKGIGKIVIKEYGFYCFLQQHCVDMLAALKKYFPSLWKQILVMAYDRLVFHSTIRNMDYHYQRSFLSEAHQVDLGEKTARYHLRDIGRARTNATRYMKSFIKAGDHVLIDATNIYSYSNNINYVKKGYTKDKTYNTQFCLLYLYSSSLKLPVFYRLFDGDIKDVSMVALAIKESSLQEVLIVGDKGFFSEDNIGAIQKAGLTYVIPLHRNSTKIDYGWMDDPEVKGGNYFKHEGRYILYWSRPNTGEDNSLSFGKGKTTRYRKIILYLDESLRQKESDDYRDHMVTHPSKYNLDGYQKKKMVFGTFTMQVDLKEDLSAPEIYAIYKSRGSIETMFDGLKNIVDVDSTYMQNPEALQGWIFINHVAIQWYYKLYMLMKNAVMLKHNSVSDIIMKLKDVRKVKINGQWLPEQVNDRTVSLLRGIGIDVT